MEDENIAYDQNIFVDVWLPLPVPGTYTYRLRRIQSGMVIPGMRVLVSFGKKKLYAAIVVRLHSVPPSNYEAKYVTEILDTYPVVGEPHLRFWEWLSRYYLSTPGEVMRVALPSGFKIQSDTHYYLADTYQEIPSPKDLAAQELVQLFRNKGKITINEIRNHPGKDEIFFLFKDWLRCGYIRISEEWDEKFRPKLLCYVRIHPETDMQVVLPFLEKKSFRQAECVLFLLSEAKAGRLYEEGWMEKKNLLQKFDASVVRTLVKKGILEEIHAPVSRIALPEQKEKYSLSLSVQQDEAYQQIKKLFDENKPVLLHGVTGSGKTEIYIRLMEDAIREGKQVLYLLPEIALTIHHIRRLRMYFGNKVGIYHSRFNSHERVEIWQMLLENNRNADAGFQIILAPRSGIFLPFERLGLVVVDEEHDSSYKQSQMEPRYHARDAALYLASNIFPGCRIILGSATPSLESIFMTQSGRWGKVRLDKKFYKLPPAELQVVDMNREYSGSPEPVWVSSYLREKTLEIIKAGKQALYFLGRRGYAPYYRCRHCHHVKMCSCCDVPLVYHKNPGHLLCHYCGFTSGLLWQCEKCGSYDMMFMGGGTEKIEEILRALFPDLVIERMDLDNTRTRHAYEDILERFEQKKIHILVGTHLITKGMDFANIALVAILHFDRHLHFPDFRAFERAYQLAIQLQGRTSRRDEPGCFIIQTYEPENPLLNFLKNNTTDAFYSFLMQQREKHGYPPYYRLIEGNLVSSEKEMAAKASEDIKNEFIRTLPANLKPFVQIVGPEWPLVSKIKNKFIRKLLIKYSRSVSIHQVYSWLHFLQPRIHEIMKKHKSEWHWNVDP